MPTIELKPIRESTEEWDALEARIKDYFKRLIYLPLLRELRDEGDVKIMNAKRDHLVDAIRSGRIQFNQGLFTGKFSIRVSAAIKALGARWDRGANGFRISKGLLPDEVVRAVEASEASFLRAARRIDEKLAQILPAKFADMIKTEDIFDRTIYKTEQKFEDSVKGITVAPTLTDDQKKTITKEWSSNIKLQIQEFTEKEIRDLREKVQTSVFAGNRYESLVQSIQKSYNVTANKAKFLARQETNLLTAKFKQSRYQSAGVNEYIWRCVAGSALHPVRPDHKKLEGKTFRFDNPPITDAKTGARNNPGEDFNCRCYARPVVRF